MARDIDFDNPDGWDDDDLEYLRQRESLVDEAELQGVEGVRERITEYAERSKRPEPEGDVPYDPNGPRPGDESFDKSDSEEEEEELDEEEGDEDETDYNELSVDELRDYLRQRGLPTGGKKEELVARLEADDEGHRAEGV